MGQYWWTNRVHYDSIGYYFTVVQTTSPTRAARGVVMKSTRRDLRGKKMRTVRNWCWQIAGKLADAASRFRKGASAHVSLATVNIVLYFSVYCVHRTEFCSLYAYKRLTRVYRMNVLVHVHKPVRAGQTPDTQVGRRRCCAQT